MTGEPLLQISSVANIVGAICLALQNIYEILHCPIK